MLNSKGGAKNGDAYLKWIDKIAAGVEEAPAVMILEPDTLGQLEKCTEPSKQAERYKLANPTAPAPAVPALANRGLSKRSNWHGTASTESVGVHSACLRQSALRKIAEAGSDDSFYGHVPTPLGAQSRQGEPHLALTKSHHPQSPKCCCARIDDTRRASPGHVPVRRAVHVPDSQPTAGAALDNHSALMNCAVVSATHRDQIASIMPAPVSPRHNVMNVHERGMATARKYAATAVAP